MIKNIILYLFICLSIACAVIIAYKRKTKKGKFLSCLILIFCAAVVLLVNIFPVENLWMKFNNPEEIIEYDKKRYGRQHNYRKRLLHDSLFNGQST